MVNGQLYSGSLLNLPSGGGTDELQADAQADFAGRSARPARLRTFFSEGMIGIRPFNSDDVPALFAATRESIPELCGWMAWCHADYSLADCHAFMARSAADWKKGERHSFAIMDLRDGTLLGSVGLSPVPGAPRCANIGYWVRTSRTRRGIASIAAKLIARFGFEELGLERIELLILDQNKNSRRVAERMGAALERRSRVSIRGVAHDALLYSLAADRDVSYSI